MRTMMSFFLLIGSLTFLYSDVILDVGPNEDFITIQAAVDQAIFYESGLATINVHDNDSYYGHVLIDILNNERTDLTGIILIKADDSATCTINGLNQDNAISVYLSDIIPFYLGINGFTITGGYEYGVNITGANMAELSIVNNTFEDNYFYLDCSSGEFERDNSLTIMNNFFYWDCEGYELNESISCVRFDLINFRQNNIIDINNYSAFLILFKSNSQLIMSENQFSVLNSCCLAIKSTPSVISNNNFHNSGPFLPLVNVCQSDNYFYGNNFSYIINENNYSAIRYDGYWLSYYIPFNCILAENIFTCASKAISLYPGAYSGYFNYGYQLDLVNNTIVNCGTVCTIDNTNMNQYHQNRINTFTNNIAWDINDFMIFEGDDLSEPIVIEYSCIDGGIPIDANLENGEGNISSNPLFVDPANNEYELRWDSDAISPCIDSGNPSQVDNDGTPSDMGCYPAIEHDYHKVVANSSRIRWRSFPVIDRDIVDEGEEAEYILAPVEEQTDYFKLLYRDNEGNDFEKTWNSEYWVGNLDYLDSTQGYKIRANYDVEIPVPGTKQADNTVMQLYEGYNWLGYFIEEPMSVADAFAPIWDKFVNCASEDWFVAKVGGISPERCSLIYGKLYIVKVNEDCSLVWGQSGGPIEPRERTMTEAFTYEETYDYSPIIIESLDDLDIEEVGVFLNDECIGATQVEEFPLQILAFVPEENRGEYTFQFYTGDRNYVEKRNFQVYDERLNQYITKDLDLIPYELTYVSFDNNEVIYPFELMVNYPNPFNPTTTIQYSLPKDSHVELAVYNIKGQKVKTLINEIQIKGMHEIEWNGKDATDKPVNSGIYLYKLTCEGKTDIKKMTLLK